MTRLVSTVEVLAHLGVSRCVVCGAMVRARDDYAPPGTTYAIAMDFGCRARFCAEGCWSKGRCQHPGDACVGVAAWANP